MQRSRSAEEVDFLIQLARSHCELKAAHRTALAAGSLSAEEDASIQMRLARLDRRIEQLKGSNEIERICAGEISNIIPLMRFDRKAAR